MEAESNASHSLFNPKDLQTVGPFYGGRPESRSDPTVLLAHRTAS
jgi:hypothetical protein